jgi:hypothetical protein
MTRAARFARLAVALSSLALALAAPRPAAADFKHLHVSAGLPSFFPMADFGDVTKRGLGASVRLVAMRDTTSRNGWMMDFGLSLPEEGTGVVLADPPGPIDPTLAWFRNETYWLMLGQQIERKWGHLVPYGWAGAGVGYLRVKGRYEPLTGIAIVPTEIQDSPETWSFAYTLGLGTYIPLNRSIDLDLGVAWVGLPSTEYVGDPAVLKDAGGVDYYDVRKGAANMLLIRVGLSFGSSEAHYREPPPMPY